LKGRLADKFCQGFFVKTYDELFASANNWTTQQVGFGNYEFDQFAARRKFFGKTALFVNGVSSVQEWRNVIVRTLWAKDRFDLFGGQRFFCVIAFDDLAGIFAHQVAQETPGIAACRSGAFVEEDHSDFELLILDF
jgi:hypothetical protein